MAITINRRQFGFLAGAAVAASSLTACSGSGSGSGQGKVVWSTWGSPEDLKSYDKFQEAFKNEHPDVELVFQPTPSYSEYHSKLLTQLSSGTAPDVFYIGDDRVASVIRNSVLMAIGDKLGDATISEDDFAANVLDIGRWEGDLYALPNDVNPDTLWYDKQALEAAGITDDPAELADNDQWTTEAFFDMTAKLAAAGLTGAVYWNYWATHDSFMTAQGGKVYDEAGKYVAHEDPASVQAMEDYAKRFQSDEMKLADLLPEGAGSETLLVTHKLGFLAAGRYTIGAIRGAGVDESLYDIVRWPTVDGTAKPTGVAASYLAINSKAGDPESALTFFSSFLDAEGRSMAASVTGGTILVTQNGNRWIGAGHNSIFTDATGRDWLSYHALDRAVPWLNEPFGINRRPMLIDRIDWIDGWPTVRGGAGPSEGPQPAPVTSSLLDATPWAPADGFAGMTASTEGQGGDVGVITGVSTSLQELPAGDVRLTLDVMPGAASFAADLGSGLVVTLNPSANTFSLTAPGTAKSVAMRPTDGWRRVVVTVRGTSIEAEVSEGGLKAPSSRITATSPDLLRQRTPLALTGNAMVDNLWVQTPAVGLQERVEVPQPGDRLWQEDFANRLDDRWSWVRDPGDVTVDDGLHWPLRPVDLVGDANNGSLLLTDVEDTGDWIIETEFTLDLGEDDVRNYQQAGLIAHRTDDDFARLSSVAIWGTRTVEFGREIAVAPDDSRTSWGGAIVGANAPTMRMRLAHHLNDQGEHLFRAGISTDGGQNWIWGAVWTFAPGAQPRVGLHTGGGSQNDAVATFHYVSLFDGVWPEDDGSLPSPSVSPSPTPTPSASTSPSRSPEPTASPSPSPSSQPTISPTPTQLPRPTLGPGRPGRPPGLPGTGC